MKNRRNYYRILQVQPEASADVIKASYRVLMTKLNAHPDRGGDHETAVLLNQAYAVLSDVQKRKKYDDMLLGRVQDGRKTGEASPFNKNGTSSTYNPYSANGNQRHDRSASEKLRHACIFCHAEFVPNLNKYCHQCKSPLALAKKFTNRRSDELYGRRSVPRIAKQGELVIFPSWPHHGHVAQLQDLSLSGLQISTGYPAKTGETLKIDSAFFKGIGKVVSVRSNSRHFLVHATFLTAEFITKSGTFFAQKT